MVETDGGGRDESDLASGQKGAVAAGAGAGDQRIGIPDVRGADFSAGQIDHFKKRFQYPFQERDFIIGDNLHFRANLLCRRVLTQFNAGDG